MRKSWLFALAVIVVGGLAGAAIAGRPEPADPFVLNSDITVPVDVSTTSPASSTTTTARATPTPVGSTSTIAAATSTSIAVRTTSTSEAPTTTEAATTTTTIAGLLPRDQVRLVIANGDGRFKLATITAARIRPLGYLIELGDALQPVSSTIIYYRPGFDDEAAVVANDISVPDAVITALPTNASQTVTNADLGDVIVVLGPDALR